MGLTNKDEKSKPPITKGWRYLAFALVETRTIGKWTRKSEARLFPTARTFRTAETELTFLNSGNLTAMTVYYVSGSLFVRITFSHPALNKK